MTFSSKILRRTAIVAALLVCLVFGASPALAASYTTDSYDVFIAVSKDNTYQVKENISVNFATQKHGIFRYIPYGNFDDMGYMSIKDIDVPGWNFSDYSEDGNMVVQIGDEDETVTGRQNYEINYRMVVHDDRDESKDFFYVDILPTGWETAIKSSSATIVFPKKIDEDKIKVYSGRYGFTGSGDVQWNYDKKTKTLSVNASGLEQGKGITVLCELPEGYWEGEAGYGWSKALAVAMGLALPVVIILLWFFFGRDKRIVPTVEFYPPEGMTPAEVGFIIDNAVDKRDIVSLILYFAEKGYISIEQETEKSIILRKLRDIEPKEKNFAKTLFRGLFKKGDEINFNDLDEDFGESYLTAIEQLRGRFSSVKNRQMSIKSAVFQVLGMVMTVVLLIANMLLAEWYSAKTVVMVFAAIAAIAVAIILAVAVVREYMIYTMKPASKKISSVIVWLLQAISVCAYSYLIGMVMFEAVWIFVMLAVLLMGACIATVLMRQRTAKSIAIMGKVLGLKNFIETAELSKINALVEENPGYFYNILPYAYVMGLTDKWVKKFENIPMVKPSWYVGRDIDMFDIWMISNMTRACGRSFEKNIHIPTGGDSGSGGGGFSSGGGFGGFSGGGFGGGGGGSW